MARSMRPIDIIQLILITCINIKFLIIKFHYFQVSFIDSWFLCLSPIKRMLLKRMRKADDVGKNGVQRQIVYSFGDHYYFRKELKILNLLTGYRKFVFL